MFIVNFDDVITNCEHCGPALLVVVGGTHPPRLQIGLDLPAEGIPIDAEEILAPLRFYEFYCNRNSSL